MRRLPCSTRGILAAIAALSFAVRVAFLARGARMPDQLFVPDDAYYTLSIARSLARGLGPTADGVTLTSGFQPLIAFLLTPVFWIHGLGDAPLYADWVLGSAADAASAFLLGTLAARIGGSRAGIATALLWSLSSVAIANALNGLETSLAVALELAVVVSWPRAQCVSWRKARVLSGILAGLALLARIDAVFLLATLGSFDLLKKRWRETGTTAFVALLVVAPWWLYCLVHFGSVVPSSGSAVHAIVDAHRELYLTAPVALGWAAGSVLGSPFVEAPGLCDFASADPVFGVGLWLVVILLVVLATYRLFVRRMGWLSPYTALAAFGLCLFAFYSLYLPALWFCRRYFAPLHAFAALSVGTALALAARQSRASRWARGLIWFCYPATFLLVVKTGLLLIVAPTDVVDSGLHGAKGYRAPAHDVLDVLPRNAVVGALQSGALAYYADGSPRVVALDGVVDPTALRAVQERTLSDYAAARGVTHFADWPFNRGMFLSFSERARRRPLALEPVGAARPQGNERFEVVRVVWPE